VARELATPGDGLENAGELLRLAPWLAPALSPIVRNGELEATLYFFGVPAELLAARR
jgi:hypothetical protein